MRATVCWWLSAALSCSYAVPTRVAAQAPDRNTLQTVGLFRMACMRFVGRPNDLRAWIAERHLRRAVDLPMGLPARSQTFGASTPDGKLALVSVDDGSCAVVAEHGALALLEGALTGALRQDGVTVVQGRSLEKPDGSSVQHLYRASYGTRHWVLSITSVAYPDRLAGNPEAVLLASGGN